VEILGTDIITMATIIIIIIIIIKELRTGEGIWSHTPQGSD
jgi:hypothetical protein